MRRAEYLPILAAGVLFLAACQESQAKRVATPTAVTRATATEGPKPTATQVPLRNRPTAQIVPILWEALGFKPGLYEFDNSGSAADRLKRIVTFGQEYIGRSSFNMDGNEVNVRFGTLGANSLMLDNPQATIVGGALIEASFLREMMMLRTRLPSIPYTICRTDLNVERDITAVYAKLSFTEDIGPVTAFDFIRTNRLMQVFEKAGKPFPTKVSSEGVSSPNPDTLLVKGGNSLIPSIANHFINDPAAVKYFSEYLTAGTDFRGRILYGLVRGLQEDPDWKENYRDLSIRYEASKDFMAGVETTTNGRLKTASTFSIGQIYSVDRPDPWSTFDDLFAGNLRPEPIAELPTPAQMERWPLLLDGLAVRITEGPKPQVVANDALKRAYLMSYVEVGKIVTEPDGSMKFVSENPRQFGYVANEGLGVFDYARQPSVTSPCQLVIK